VVGDRALNARKSDEATEINGEKGVQDLKERKVCVRFVHLLTSDQEHQCTASSVEYIEIIDDARNVL
jgi:hypothetical protein